MFLGSIAFCQKCKATKYERCKRALTQIERERAEARAERYQVVSCAICLDTFAETSNMETHLLQCGHTFHRQCLEDWQNSNAKCPICRQTMYSDEESIASLTTLSVQANYQEEYVFRLQRAHSLYPQYISPGMVDRWTAPGWIDSPLVSDTTFIRNSPSYGHTTNSNFSGGVSSGGGGAGGSW